MKWDELEFNSEEFMRSHGGWVGGTSSAVRHDLLWRLPVFKRDALEFRDVKISSFSSNLVIAP